MLRKGRDIVAQLVSLSPDDAGWKRDRVWFDNRLAQSAR